MSSFYDDASLVVIPSGYKTSKVYAEKPTDGSGDLAFTRTGDTATRVNSAGLIEKVRTNLVTYSQDFSNAAWLIGTGQTKTVSQTDPNGGTTAVLISNVSEANGYLSHALTLTANVPNTFSIYIKGSSSGSVSIRLDDSGAGPQFDINYTTSWQRFSVTRTVNQSSCFLTVGGYSTWAIGENIQFAFAQVETGDIATDYIPTTTAAVSVGPVANLPRIDYTGGGCGKLLLEPQRTNVITFSETFNNAAWTKSGATITANATTSPDGYLNADKLVENSSLSSHYVNVSNLFTADGSLRAWSLFVKEGERRYIFITNVNTINNDINCVVFDTRLGVFTNTNDPTLIVTRKVQALENGWYRIDFTSAVNNGAYDNFFIGISSTSNMSGVSYLGDGTSGLYIYGAQLELGAYATSYIPTLGASVTRGADACVKTGISSLIGQTEGTLFADFVAQPTPTSQSHLWLAGTSGNEIGVYGNSQFVFYSSGGVSIAGPSLVAGTRYKIAFAYKANDYVAYINGAQTGVDTSATVPATSALYINSYSDFTEIQKKEVNQTLLFKTRLSNSELASLTTL